MPHEATMKTGGVKTKKENSPLLKSIKFKQKIVSFILALFWHRLA